MTFDPLADRYDQWYLDNPSLLSLEREAIARLEMSGRILDVGCGTGMLTPPGSMGLDPSLHMLRLARARGVRPIRGVAEALPFRDSSFDHVLMVATISFLGDREMAVQEAARVLRPGGTFGICFINSRSAWGDLYRRKGSEGHPIYRMARFMGIDEIRRLVRQAGLETELVLSCLHHPPGSDLPDRVWEGPEGGFVCIRVRKPQARG